MYSAGIHEGQTPPNSPSAGTSSPRPRAGPKRGSKIRQRQSRRFDLAGVRVRLEELRRLVSVGASTFAPGRTFDRSAFFSRTGEIGDRPADTRAATRGHSIDARRRQTLLPA